jgi:excisionase family DNA binding protein
MKSRIGPFLTESPIGRMIIGLFSDPKGKDTATVKLVRAIEEKNEALRVRDIAQILGVSVQQIYKLAAKGQIPCFRIANSVRFDPQEFAGWLRDKYPSSRVSPMDRIARSA